MLSALKKNLAQLKPSITFTQACGTVLGFSESCAHVNIRTCACVCISKTDTYPGRIISSCEEACQSPSCTAPFHSEWCNIKGMKYLWWWWEWMWGRDREKQPVSYPNVMDTTMSCETRLSVGWTQSRARLPSHADRPEDTRTAICSATSAVSTSTSLNQSAQCHQRQHTNKVSIYKHTLVQKITRYYGYKRANIKSSDKLLQRWFRTTWLRPNFLNCITQILSMLHLDSWLDSIFKSHILHGLHCSKMKRY